MSAPTLRALMHHHRDVRRLRSAPLRATLRALVVLLVVGGLLAAARAAGASSPPACPGLPPSCHLRQHPECVCSGPSVTQCKWMCVWEAKGASE